MYADDTVIYCGGKSIQTIEMKLTQDLEENELVVNLKKGKTEVMLFGTAMRLSLHNHQLGLKFCGILINNTETYMYLGHIVNKSLTLWENFDRAYKKCCNQLKLLSKLCYLINSNAALRIYQTMIQLFMTYAGLLKSHFSETQLGKMEAIECRSRSIISSRTGNPVPSIVQSLHKKACKTVRQCIDKYICTNFHQYFQIHEHNFNARNKGYSIKIPKVKLENGVLILQVLYFKYFKFICK